MRWTWQRITLAFVDALGAVSAIGGGYALMAGTIQPSGSLASGTLSWLINSYFVAGELLLVVTGGTALVAFVAMLLNRTAGAGFSAGAGLVMMGWIVSEVLIIASFSWLQVFYFAVGLAMFALAIALEPTGVRFTAHRLHQA